MYEQEITRKHRTAFIFAVDRSLSMREMTGTVCGITASKAEMVAFAVNGVISELAERARYEEGIRNYYDIAVIGYSGDEALSLLGGRRFVPVSELPLLEPEVRNYPVTLHTADGRPVVRERKCERWIKPEAEGGTPMYGAFSEIYDMLREWCADPCNADSFPPVVINITDGEASDCTPAELEALARRIMGLGTSDGNVILMNIHMTAGGDGCRCLFPAEGEIPADDRYASMLARCSSVLPPSFEPLVRDLKGSVPGGPFRAMGYNASPESLVMMLDIGSRSVSGIR